MSTQSANTSSFNKNQSIYGINVQGTGLPIDIAEISERKDNLEQARMVEEQERSRRIQEWDQCESSASRLASRREIIKLEEQERERRMKDSAEGSRRELAKTFSASIAKDILSPTLRISQAARDAVESAKQAGKGFIYGAGSYAYRAVNFFSGIAKEQAQVISDKAAQVTQQVQAAKDQAVEKTFEQVHKAQDLGNKAYEQVQAAKDQAVEKTFEQVQKAQDLGNKALEQVQSVKDQVLEKTDQVKSLASQQVQQLSDKAEQLTVLAAGLGGWGYTMTTAKLTYLEEAERLWRTTGGLDVERFLLAVNTSNLVRDFLIQYDRNYSELNEANRWYATSIMEDFERARRINSKTDSAVENAKKIAHAIHLNDIRTSAFRPSSAQINKVEQLFAKKADGRIAAQNAKRVAGMVHLNNIRQNAYRPQQAQLKKLDGVYRKKIEQRAAAKKARQVARLVHLHNIETSGHQPQPAQLNKISEVISKKAEAINTVPTRAMAAM